MISFLWAKDNKERDFFNLSFMVHLTDDRREIVGGVWMRILENRDV